MLIPVHEGLWVCPVPYRVMGIWLGRQLVVARLPNGRLWIESPIPLTPDLRRELAQLGEVQHVIGPNCFHDEQLKEFQAAYVHATFHAAPGLAAARPDLRFADTLSDTPLADWSATFTQHVVRGMPRLNEVVFLHRASRSLLIADLAFNIGPDGPWLTAFAMTLNNVWGRFSPSLMCRNLMKDRAAVRSSLDLILSWDFDRIIVGHGRNIETGGKAALRKAFAFLLER